jgi:hypothetical protein
LLGKNGGTKNCIEREHEIKVLFEGYPDFFVENYFGFTLKNKI